MKIHVRAPATTANVGPGFDCVAIALDLWNEVVVSEGEGELDRHHLGVRGFEKLVPADGKQFDWTDRIPRERGLGSSAAVIALGVVAATHWLDRAPDLEELLAVGVELEGHPDNLAAALAGGVCLTSKGRIARIADKAPAVPIAVVPDPPVSTVLSRAGLPAMVSHTDAAYTAGHAAFLGAALASGSADLLAQALDDRLHEPYRAGDAPLLRAVRDDLPAGAVGATLSGSGPTVIVWARADAAEDCAHELSRSFRQEQVMRLEVTPAGAGGAG